MSFFALEYHPLHRRPVRSLTSTNSTYEVAPICGALGIQGTQIAPRTYWAHRNHGCAVETGSLGYQITEVRCGYYEPDGHGKRPPESL
ncbi:hypothetical protein MBOT_10050 [Mycobacterium botniense]|uniref:Uncharacterized protein n=1 Tax=Mycobacterium botniense TaxID=84962 RepID=A0A7I9XV90_9MYCO|nr:hypothetical protein MBOT_10050 [Mycobacterium botniense]